MTTNPEAHESPEPTAAGQPAVSSDSTQESGQAQEPGQDQDQAQDQTQTQTTPPVPPAATNPAGGPPPRPHTGPPRPRTGPIVWGALVLAFCAYVATSVVSGGAVDTSTWIITTVIGLGVLLLAVGLAVLIRSGRERERPRR